MRLILGTMLVLGSFAANAWAYRAQMEMIPDPFSAEPRAASFGADMSSDGRFVVGTFFNGDGYQWDSFEDTWTVWPSEGPGSWLTAVSDDGTVALGNIDNPIPGEGSVAGMWTATTQTWTSLGHFPDALNCPSKSSSWELSGDGTVAVGLSWVGCNARGFRWTEETGMIELESLANGNNRASVVSADGDVIAGFAQGSFSRTPAVWDGTTTQGQLLDPPNGDVVGEVYGIRDDGSLLLGTWSGDATKWTDDNGVWVREQIGSGSFRPGWTGIPRDIADDGTLIGFDLLNGTVARGWLEYEGTLQEIGPFVTAGGGSVPLFMGAPIVPEFPQAISANGRIILGGTRFVGAWRVEIFADCDFDSDFDCDIDDIDALIGAIASGSTDELFDLTGDGVVDLADRDDWLMKSGAENLPSGAAYLVADANLDGVVDVSDFNIWNGSKFTSTAAWSRGDFNADGVIDVSDFNLWNANKFNSSDGMAIVPEPHAVSLFLSVLLAVCGFVRGGYRGGKSYWRKL